MTSEDFYAFESRLSASQVSKSGKPLLDNVVLGQFRKGSSSLFFKTSHKDENFHEHEFLLKKCIQPILKGNVVAKKKCPVV